MSLFSTTLQIIIERQPGSRAAFAERIGIPNSTLHTYVHGTATPDVAALEKLCQGLDEADRAELVIAHLRDNTPPSAKELIQIVSLVSTPRIAEETSPFDDIKLPKKLREDFLFLMQRATHDRQTANWISGTVDLITGRK